MTSPRTFLSRLFVSGTSMLAALTFGCAGSLVGPDTNSDHATLFDEAWRQFDLHYSFFELKQINWDSLGAQYRPLAIAAGSDEDFANVLAHMLAELRDVHVSITPFGAGSTVRYMSPSDTCQTYFSAELVFRRYVPSSFASPTGHLRSGMLTPSIAYIRIPNFEGGGWTSEIDAALDQLRAATSIVVDVRNNRGGEYAAAAAIAGRFADRARIFGYVRYRSGQQHSAFTAYSAETVAPSGPRQFTGRVYVLSNRRDFSSAEDFILAMRVLPRTTIVGDTTAGASGGPIVRELSNGWSYQLSEWIEYTPERRTFEGIGLAPNVFVKATSADVLLDRDAALERALALAR